jgi:hypothetical protein
MAGRQLEQDVREYQKNRISITDSPSAESTEPEATEDIRLMPLWSSPIYLTYTQIQEHLNDFHKECHFNNLAENEFLMFVTLKAREKRKKDLKNMYPYFLDSSYDSERERKTGFAWFYSYLHQYIFPSINDPQYKAELALEAINVIELCSITRYRQHMQSRYRTHCSTYFLHLLMLVIY